MITPLPSVAFPLPVFPPVVFADAARGALGEVAGAPACFSAAICYAWLAAVDCKVLNTRTMHLWSDAFASLPVFGATLVVLSFKRKKP